MNQFLIFQLNRNTAIGTPEFKANPYPFYAPLRHELPVCRLALPGRTEAWLITRYDDVPQALRDDSLIKNKLNALHCDHRFREWSC